MKEYDKKLPIDLITYDDASDIGNMTRLFEKFMVQDKVDFVLSPWSTDFLYAAAPLATKYKYVLVGGAGGAVQLSKEMPNYPYYFQVLNAADTQIPVLAKVLKENNIKTVAIAYGENLHGVEYNDEAKKVFPQAGLEIKMDKSYVLGTKDLSPILESAKALNVDAFISFSYPDETIGLTAAAISHNINFKAFFSSVFTYTPTYRDMFGSNAVEGIMGGGGWSEKSPGGAEFTALYKKHFNKEVDDKWGQLYYYASLQHLQAAIEEAGTLDQSKIRDLVATKSYKTILGEFKYDKDRTFRGYFGSIGMWHNGVYELVDPGQYRTATPIIKPAWPPKK